MQQEFDYLTEAKKTASPHFHTEKVNPAELYTAMINAVRALDIVDKMRKAIFYANRAYDSGKIEVPKIIAHRDYPDLPPHLIHGILGAACEGGEKLDILIRAMDGLGFDVTNYVEECGDSLWFDSIGLDAIGMTMEEVMGVNIKKLRQRSGESFSKTSFNERDLISERKVLDNNVIPAVKGDKERVRKE